MTQGRIAIYGATGFAGKAVTAELARRDARLRLVGRDQSRVREVSTACAPGAELAVASLHDPAGLVEAFSGCCVVLNCVGPFARFGEPVVRSALAAGAHYLDISGECNWIKRVLDDFGEEAANAGLTVLPAVGLDSIPGDMLAAVTVAGARDIERIEVILDLGGVIPNAGSLLSLYDLMRSGEGWDFQDGRFSSATRELTRGARKVPGIGRVRTIKWPGAEIVLVPRHIDCRSAEVNLTTRLLPTNAVPGGLVVMGVGALQLLARSPVHAAVRRLLARFPSPSRELPVHVECIVGHATGTRRSRLRAEGGYSLTAVCAAEAAIRAASGRLRGSGALTPAQAFEPAEFLRTIAADHRLSYQIDEAWA